MREVSLPSGRRFGVAYYTSRRRALLLSSPADWEGSDTTIDCAFLGVEQFDVALALPGLRIFAPEGPSAGEAAQVYELAWEGGSGRVVARSFDIDVSDRRTIFADKWGILGANPPWPAKGERP